MKKIIALTLAFLILSLCSCSDSKKNDTSREHSTSSVHGETTAEVSTVEYITEWGINLLPDDFPPPPSGAHSFEYEQVAADEEYASDRVRIRFTCPENEIYRFTNDLIKAGYSGGAKKINSPSTYFKPGFNGYWQNGKNYIRVAESKYEENGELTLRIDITECKDNFPAVLTNIFPKFDGYTKSNGVYSEYDDNKNQLDNEFIGSLNANSWTWGFASGNSFVGVTLEELDSYIDKLVNAGFSGSHSTSVTDGCTTIFYDLVKEKSDKTYGVLIAYNQILKTMDIVYTNDIFIFIQE